MWAAGTLRAASPVSPGAAALCPSYAGLFGIGLGVHMSVQAPLRSEISAEALRVRWQNRTLGSNNSRVALLFRMRRSASRLLVAVSSGLEPGG